MPDEGELAAIYLRACKIIIADPEFQALLLSTISEAITSQALQAVYLRAVQLVMADPKFVMLVGSAVHQTLHQFTERIETLLLTKEPVLLTNQQAARLMRVSPKSLSEMRARGQGPKWSGRGKWVRYEPIEIVAWFRSLPKTADDNG